MRIFIIIAAVAGATIIADRPTVAASASPWCLKAAVTDDAIVDKCEFQTFERCAQERFNYGTTSFCVQNPAYNVQERDPARKSKRNVNG